MTEPSACPTQGGPEIVHGGGAQETGRSCVLSWHWSQPAHPPGSSASPCPAGPVPTGPVHAAQPARRHELQWQPCVQWPHTGSCSVPVSSRADERLAARSCSSALCRKGNEQPATAHRGRTRHTNKCQGRKPVLCDAIDTKFKSRQISSLSQKSSYPWGWGVTAGSTGQDPQVQWPVRWSGCCLRGCVPSVPVVRVFLRT